MSAQLTPDTMVFVMLQSEQKWMLIESFVTLVIKMKELDGRAERGNNECQERLHRGLHPRSCVSDRLGCPRRSGEISFLFLPWSRRVVSLPKGRVAADRSRRRTDDGRVERDFKLEPTAREV